MSTEDEAKAVIRRWNDEGWSAGNYEVAYELVAPEMTAHGAGGQPIGMGPDGFIDLVRQWRTAFPDGYMTIDDLFAEGDLVVIRNTWHGTHRAPFWGIPLSGHWVDVTCVGIDRVVDGKVVEGWGELDMVGMMQRMGALPLVGPGAVAHGEESEWGPTLTPPGPAAPAGELKRLLVAFIAAVAAGDRAAAEEVADPGFVDHNPAWDTTSLDDLLASSAELRAAMPDLAADVEHHILVAEGDQVAAHTILTGTHTGEDLFGVEASGNRATWTQSDVVRVAGGRIAERWVSADTLTLFQQLGVVPSPG